MIQNLNKLTKEANNKGWTIQRFDNPTPRQCPHFYRLVRGEEATLWHGYWSNLVAFVEGAAFPGGDYDLQYGVNFGEKENAYVL